MGIDRTKRQRKKAAKLLLIRLLTSAILGLLIVACFHAYNYLTTTDKLAIDEVEFSGLDRLNAAELDGAVADLRGQNILLVPLDEYAARFAEHPRIRSAELRKVLPNKVICVVSEREPVALVYTKKFLEVDADGMILNEDGLTDLLDLPIITGLDGKGIEEGTVCHQAELAGALKTLEICKTYGGRFAENISELRVGKGGISIVSLEDGMVLLLGDSQFENRLKKFFLMRNTIASRDESSKLIDLRFDDQIVLRSGI